MGVGIDFWLQLAVLLACLFFAAPRGGMTLGMMGGIGLVVFVFGFIRCHTTFRHPFNFSWSGKTCDIRRSSKTTS